MCVRDSRKVPSIYSGRGLGRDDSRRLCAALFVSLYWTRQGATPCGAVQKTPTPALKWAYEFGKNLYYVDTCETDQVGTALHASAGNRTASATQFILLGGFGVAGPGCLHVSKEACQNLHMAHEQGVNKRVLSPVLCPSTRVPLSGHRELCAMCKCQGATK